MKKESTLKKNRNEILWNLINAGLAGSLVFLGSLVNDGITLKGLAVAFIASLIIAVTKFKDYWSKEEGEYTSKIFKFV